jgi:hypothetical protein
MAVRLRVAEKSDKRLEWHQRERLPGASIQFCQKGKCVASLCGRRRRLALGERRSTEPGEREPRINLCGFV